MGQLQAASSGRSDIRAHAVAAVPPCVLTLAQDIESG